MRTRPKRTMPSPKITSQSSPSSNRANEDAVGLGNRAVVLADGASGLGRKPQLFPEHGSDAAWLASSYCQGILACIGRGVPSLESVFATQEELCRDWALRGGDLDTPLELPSCTLDVISWDDDSIEVLQIGDSPVFILLRNGKSIVLDGGEEMRQLHENNMSAMMSALAESNHNVDMANEIATPKFAATREQKNQEGGYHIADITTAWLPHMQNHSFAREDVQAILAASDGYAAVIDYDVMSADELLRQACEGKASEVISIVRQMEDADPDMRVHPRLKHHDDATFAFLFF